MFIYFPIHWWQSWHIVINQSLTLLIWTLNANNLIILRIWLMEIHLVNNYNLQNVMCFLNSNSLEFCCFQLFRIHEFMNHTSESLKFKFISFRSYFQHNWDALTWCFPFLPTIESFHIACPNSWHSVRTGCETNKCDFHSNSIIFKPWFSISIAAINLSRSAKTKAC